MRIVEGDLIFDFRKVVGVIRFDDERKHGMTHCMKAVDFVVEDKNYYFFVEIKDPDNPRATAAARKAFEEKLQSSRLRNELTIKFRDSFLYRWAEDKLNKPIKYIVLLCMSTLDNAVVLQQQDNLRRNLPANKATGWHKQIVDSCAILSMKKWNDVFAQWPVKRVSAGDAP